MIQRALSAISFSISFSILAIFSFATPAFADSVSVNFEPTTYTLGVINNQDGWVSLGAAGSGCTTPYDHKVDSSFGITGFGTQSLRISDAVTSGCFGDMTFAKPLTDAVGETGATAGSFPVGSRQSHFEMQFDITSATTSAQPGLHVSVSPDRGDGSRMSYLRFEDSVSGLNVFFDDVQQPTPCTPAGCANFVETQIGTNLDRARSHTIKLALDAIDGPSNDVVKVWIDGSLAITGTSWEDYYRYDPEAIAEPSTRIIKTVIFRTSGGANPGDLGKGFLFDNLSLFSGPILIGPPTSKAQCKKDGWKIFNNPTFRNQGRCVEYIEHHNDRGRDDDQDHDEPDDNQPENVQRHHPED